MRSLKKQQFNEWWRAFAVKVLLWSINVVKYNQGFQMLKFHASEGSWTQSIFFILVSASFELIWTNNESYMICAQTFQQLHHPFYSIFVNFFQEENQHDLETNTHTHYFFCTKKKQTKLSKCKVFGRKLSEAPQNRRKWRKIVGKLYRNKMRAKVFLIWRKILQRHLFHQNSTKN